MNQYLEDGNIDMAVEMAAKVAPYVHPDRLAASAVTLRLPSQMTNEELDTVVSDLDLAIAQIEGAARRVRRRAKSANGRGRPA